MILRCQHDDTKLREVIGKAGTIFICSKCKCVYRLMVAVNDRDCFNKRFPPKPIVKLEKKQRKKKSK